MRQEGARFRRQPATIRRRMEGRIKLQGVSKMSPLRVREPPRLQAGSDAVELGPALMKHALVFAALMSALADPAVAADLAPVTKAPVAAAVYNWNGLYIGVH